MLKKAGFVDVKQLKFPMPFNPWPENPRLKLAGEYNRLNFCKPRGALDSLRRMLSASGLPGEEIEDLIAKVKAEISDEGNQIFTALYVVYGRKPYDWEVEKKEGENVNDRVQQERVQDLQANES